VALCCKRGVRSRCLGRTRLRQLQELTEGEDAPAGPGFDDFTKESK
jgi:hypothetical protein